MKHLYFIRHGESVLNARRIFAGQTDTPLTDRGREQARRAGQAIQAQGLRFDLILSSPLMRAHETAEIIASAVDYPVENIELNGLFKERSLGLLEGKPWDEYDEIANDSNGAETDAELLQRASRGLAYLRTLPFDSILVAAHGSFGRALCSAIDPTRSYDELGNAELVQLI